jgi:hemoglobin-like flavoprotein
MEEVFKSMAEALKGFNPAKLMQISNDGKRMLEDLKANANIEEREKLNKAIEEIERKEMSYKLENERLKNVGI